MIVYKRFHLNQIFGNNSCQIFEASCVEWLTEHTSSALLMELNGSQFPQSDASAAALVSVTKAYQAQYQEGLEAHYDIDLHSIYVMGFRQVISNKWTIWRVTPDITHDEYTYFIFDIQDEMVAIQFKLAQL